MDEKIIKEITMKVLQGLSGNDGRKIPIGVSGRHVHLCREHMDVLFGKGSELTFMKELMGGQFAAEESIAVVSPKLKSIGRVRVLGPLRNASQVEISKTDSFALSLKAPLRESGDTVGSAPITLVGPCGAVHINEGVIIAKRHIHMSSEDAKRLNVADRDIVNVQAGCAERGGVFKHVLVRVDDSFTLEMHIDADEANAFGVATGSFGEIV